MVCTSQSPECVPERPSRLLWPLAFGRGRCPFGSLEAVADFVHFLDDFVRPQDPTRRDPARKPLKQDLIVILGKRGRLGRLQRQADRCFIAHEGQEVSGHELREWCWPSGCADRGPADHGIRAAVYVPCGQVDWRGEGPAHMAGRFMRTPQVSQEGTAQVGPAVRIGSR